MFERWQVQNFTGGYLTSKVLPSAPNIGTSITAAPTSITLPSGWTSVALRADASLVPAREELFHGRDYGLIGAWGVDPDGRFIIFVSTRLKKLYRFDLDGNAIAVELLNSGTVSDIETANSLTPFHLQSGARGWRLATDSQVVMLFDDDYDGVIDSTELLTREDAQIAYPWESSADLYFDY